VSRTAAQILARATPAQTSVTICLDGELQAEHDRMEQALRSLPPERGSLGGPGPETEALIASLEAVRAAIVEASEAFTFRALGPDWTAYRARIPELNGVDPAAYEALYDAWCCEAAAACAVEPELTAQEFAQLQTQLSQADWVRLRTAATSVNAVASTIPFSEAAFALSLTSGAKSKRPETPASPDPSSLADSLDQSPSTSETITDE
jgi:hypothetical protein